MLELAPPGAGAVVMGTGIVSIALALDGERLLSHVLLAVTAAVWAALALLFAARFVSDRDRFRQDAATPAALTAVAGSAVLGTGLTLLGWHAPAIALLAFAFGLWAVLLPPVLRSWARPATGVGLMLTVSTESLAVLASALAVDTRAAWLVAAALLPLCVGLAFYAWVIAQFDFGELAAGRGDQWITGGALAISTLAAGKLKLASGTLGTLAGVRPLLHDATVALWALTMCWLPVLLAAECRRPRLGYDIRRWSTVFPLGMYAACSFISGTVARALAITDFARAWVWVALAVWAVVFSAMTRRAPRRFHRRRSLPLAARNLKGGIRRR